MSRYGIPAPIVTIEQIGHVVYVSVDRHYGTGPEFGGSYPTHPGSYDGPHREVNRAAAWAEAEARKASILRPWSS